jgi:dethiobiotin synthetase
MVPINAYELMTDVIRRLELPVLLASRSTLGTINHTLLSLAALRQAAAPVGGVIMIGPEDNDNRRAIEKYGDVPVIGIIPPLRRLNRDSLLEVYRTKFEPQVFCA